MNCMNCGAELTESAYCPKCGCDVVVQKQAIVLSGLYYNQGLEKACVRDLSGAIDQLKRSLKFNKLNISARNLLGLVYFETGEVVAALSEWVISKNIMPENNRAVEYIEQLQSDPNKLDIINHTIKKYNQALQSCREGNEDVAMIQLKKVLAQNPKLIKGYHLLALLHIHYEQYEKARRVLKKAAKIDKTNTTTLRFLKEIDEVTGTVTSLEPRWGGWGRSQSEKEENLSSYDGTGVIQPATFRETSVVATLLNIGIGLAVGIAIVWFLAMPARVQSVNRTANERVTEYSQQMATQSAELNQAQEQIKESEETVQTANDQIEQAKVQAESYQNLITAFNAIQNEEYTTAANAMTAVNRDVLDTDMQTIYDSILSNVSNILFTKLYEAGVNAFDYANYAEAITSLSQAKTINGEDYSTLNYLAHAYRLSGDTANANATFQEIVDKFPGTKRATDAQAYIDGTSTQSSEAAVTAETGGETGGEEDTSAEDGSQDDGSAQDESQDNTSDEEEEY
ncbi:MAG: hypothetical protein PHC41_14390 [Lachnospiraceae bacterium]|nr:hypothetical protein [Lachnospiraceae bacterium]MDD3617395.1 hypothetical protein [Lachnospiraceae bacterium]